MKKYRGQSREGFREENGTEFREQRGTEFREQNGMGTGTAGKRHPGSRAKRAGMALVLAFCLLACSLTGCGGPKNADWNGPTAEHVEGSADEGSSDGTKQEFASEEAGAGLMADEVDGAMPQENFQTEEYRAVTENGFLQVSLNPLSTFSADVDTASYSNVRRMLMQGKSPEEIPAGAVRLEEIVNYFHYEYELPKEGEPFGVTIDGTDCPWQPEHGLVRIGLRTEAIDFADSPKSNLVFLLDVSGSMDEPNKLPLLKQAFGMLVDHLGEKDRVSIVTYAGMDQIVLDGARGNEKGEIQEALQYLEAAGSTNGSAGIETAYALAEEHFLPNGNNRIILATDGDLNIGQTSESQLKTLIEQKRKSGIYLSVLGFGEGNFKDNKLETLADAGNGNYAYIDSLMEARRVLTEELGSTLYTVAEDVKLQVEFNPLQISQYRLLGYENRLLNAEDFTDDTKDAGEIGAGHTVTALYEVVWAGEAGDGISLKYQNSEPVDGEAAKEWATLKIRYKEPGVSKSKELVYAFGPEIYQPSLAEANMLLEASAAEFALLLRDSEWKGNGSYGHILGLWENTQSGGAEEVTEFLELVRLAAEGDQPPAVGLLTTDGKTVNCTYATLGTYSWTVSLVDGTAQSVNACSGEPQGWQEIAVIELERTDGKIELRLPSGMQEYTVCYWIEDSTCGVADPVPMEGDTILLEGEMAKGTYELHVTYESGDAYYGFRVI